MSINIEVNGTLYPTSSGVSAEPTHDEEYGKGGFRTVEDDTARLNLPLTYKSDGMLVFVRNTVVTWQWNEDLTIWEEYPNNITGGQIANGAITEPKLHDDSVSVRTIQDDAVETDAINDGAVTLDKLNVDVTDNYYAKTESDARYIASFTTVPSSDSASGTDGTMAKDADYLYVCVSGSAVPGVAGTWGRALLDTTFTT